MGNLVTSSVGKKNMTNVKITIARLDFLNQITNVLQYGIPPITARSSGLHWREVY
ncbi:hypothetical protein MTR_2g056020 [Medicago truncatula]|uniref:Uncharacterized protein n=1 Tax=Medicago truncatula TaxID=3880 RepID=A0A072V867_MEDTR|nr:hypothetical protein MTR_2g056020 [Medicago truncatula]